MTHLKIEQTNNIEPVSAGLVHKLYMIVRGGVDSLSNLKGIIQVPHAKTNEIEHLMETYPELNIVMTGSPYMEFEDEEVERILASKFGDGIGLTEDAVKNIKKFDTDETTYGTFQASSITKFNELEKFTSLDLDRSKTWVRPKGASGNLVCSTFYKCENLEEITLPQSVTMICKFCFLGCIKLKSLGSHTFPQILRIDAYAFCYCNSLEGTLDFPNCTSFRYDDGNRGRYGQFYQCYKITKVSLGKIDLIDAVTSTYGDRRRAVFGNCSKLRVVDFGDSITYYGGEIFAGCPEMLAVIFRNPTPPTIFDNDGGVKYSALFGSDNTKIFVPDEAIDTYRSAEYFSSLDSSKLLPISQYVESDYIDTTNE